MDKAEFEQMQKRVATLLVISDELNATARQLIRKSRELVEAERLRHESKLPPQS